MTVPGPVLPKASVAGTVVSAQTGQPVAGAMVTLSQSTHLTSVVALLESLEAEKALSIAPETTDKDGRFRFPEVDRGFYDLVVRGDGYVPQKLGQQTVDGTFEIRDLRPGIYRICLSAEGGCGSAEVLVRGEHLSGPVVTLKECLLQ